MLRWAVDKGLAADKVPANDPAAAPLGTDDEAAGAGPTPDELALARREEILERAPARNDMSARRRGLRLLSITLAAAGIVALALVMADWMGLA